MRINTNIPALLSYNALARTNDRLGKSIARLSTGLRINSAADDAAGLAISEKMRAQFRGLEQAGSNAQDGISMIQTAEGALNETHSILQRMRELAVQAANDTLTQEDRAYIQLEVDQLREEIDRISTTTQFNKKKLLDGSGSVLWSTDDLSTRVIVRGTLRGTDQFGQKTSVEGNYKIKIVATPGAAQVQKSNIVVTEEEPVVREITMTPPTTFDAEYDLANASVNITTDGVYRIYQTKNQDDDPTFNTITVAAGVNATILLEDVYISVGNGDGGGKIPNACAFDMTGATVNLFLAGRNDLGSAVGRAALEAPAGSKLTIAGDGELYTVGHNDDAAGIGGGIGDDCGEITIVSGTVVATLTDTGIGGGKGGNGGTITIIGGTVTASGDSGAGIGGGEGGNGGTITISGGTVIAYADAGAAIGGGKYGDGGTITITGGTVTAKGDDQYSGAAIGGGEGGDGGTITITGGTVTATVDTTGTRNGGAAIGGGGNINNGGVQIIGTAGSSGTIKIYAAANVTATGDTANGAENIGHGGPGGSNGDIQLGLSRFDIPWQAITANGVSLLTDPKTLTIAQGDGKRTSITLYENDTIAEIAQKINDAIAFGLGQSIYVDNLTKFCTISDGTDNTSESVYGTEDIYEGDSMLGVRRTYATLLVRSAVVGSGGELSFSGDEELLKALGFSTIQESASSRYEISVHDAHSGETVISSESVTGNTFYGLFGAIDVEFDAMANTSVRWNEDAKLYSIRRASGIFETTVHISDNSTVLQIGANEGEDMTLGLADMSARALGLNTVLLTNRESAARSLGIIDNAINTVSRQRAKLGAYQNRLEHTINNLTIASTNMQASESRIRDADMAKEMMEFTKLNILSQAGNSMLAQANQLPQNVLSLLR